MVRQVSGEATTSPSHSLDGLESSLHQDDSSCVKLTIGASVDEHPNSSASSSCSTSSSSGLGPSPPLASFGGLDLPLKCSVCCGPFSNPKVLFCFHTFCLKCLEGKVEAEGTKLTCPTCQAQTPLGDTGIEGLLPDYGVTRQLKESLFATGFEICTSCRQPETSAVARCLTCSTFLCLSCVNAHQYMRCFDGHHVVTMGELTRKSGGDIHEFNELASINKMVQDGKVKVQEIKNDLKNLDLSLNILTSHFSINQREVDEAFKIYATTIELRRTELMQELSHHYTSKQSAMSVYSKKSLEAIEKFEQMTTFIERLMKNASNAEVLVFRTLLEKKFLALSASLPEVNLDNVCNFKFISNVEAFEEEIKSLLGCIRSSHDNPAAAVGGSGSKQPPICRPSSLSASGTCQQPSHSSAASASTSLAQSIATLASSTGRFSPNSTSSFISQQDQQNMSSLMSGLPSSLSNLCMNASANQAFSQTNFYEHGLLSKRFNTAFSPLIANLAASSSNGNNNGFNQWASDKLESSNLCGLSSASSSSFGPGGGLNSHLPFMTESIVEQLSNKLISQSIFPPKSQIKRQKMIYHCKFGEFGVLEGQFTEPSGVAVNAQNDIIVADTNNHRIQIFDKEGRFKFQFGECGKRDGQLLYPNRVAVVKNSGDIIVTERSPTHQVQIYNQYGQFVRKFGANILQHPRGVCVDNKGRVIVVECKVMRVIIFDQVGNVLNKFGCSKHLEFPNGVVVNERQEIFISDNRAHCVKVFNYDGIFLRQIGGEGITNYPIGVGITAAGEVMIADNHNNFNLTVFSQDGQLVAAMESKVKHAQCFDVSLMDDGSAVLASKDYRIYIYRFVQLPQPGM